MLLFRWFILQFAPFKKKSKNNSIQEIKACPRDGHAGPLVMSTSHISLFRGNTTIIVELDSNFCSNWSVFCHQRRKLHRKQSHLGTTLVIHKLFEWSQMFYSDGKLFTLPNKHDSWVTHWGHPQAALVCRTTPASRQMEEKCSSGASVFHTALPFRSKPLFPNHKYIYGVWQK